MLTAETIKKIHERLAELFPKNLILLGGSYTTGTATEDSDLDIFLICDWMFFLNRKKYQPLVADLKKQYPILEIMLVPKMFFKHGWYNVTGKDVAGKEYTSYQNKKIFFRNAAKLAYFYLLKSALGQNKDYWKKQSDKQTKVAKNMLGDETAEKFLKFSWANYLIYNLKFIPKGNFQFMFCNPDKKIINDLKQMVSKNDTSRFKKMEEIVFPVIMW